MTDQTRRLTESLPQFAGLLAAADRRNSAKWEIVRWENTPPAIVTPDQVKRMADEPYDGSELGEQFRSRSEALEASAFWVRNRVRGYSEREHWGVWVWTENGSRKYQTVMPIVPFATPKSTSANGLEPPRTSQSGTMVRVSESAYELLRRLADEDGTSLQAAADAAINEYDRQRYFSQADAAYRRLKSNRAQWAEELKERAELEATLLDDIETDEVWPADGSVEIGNREPQHA